MDTVQFSEAIIQDLSPSFAFQDAQTLKQTTTMTKRPRMMGASIRVPDSDGDGVCDSEEVVG